MRREASSSPPSSPATPGSDTHTPRARTKALLRQCLRTPKHVSPRIVKRLDASFGLMSAMKHAKRTNPEVIPILEGLLQEEVIGKSRLKASIRKHIGVHNRFGDRQKPDAYQKYRKTRSDAIADTLKMKILCFYNDDDNSTMLPGIKDAVSMPVNAPGGGDVGDTISLDQPEPGPRAGEASTSSAHNPKKPKKEKRQTRQLNDYVYNLFDRFVFQNPLVPVKSTTFYALRPANIKLVCYLVGASCLCKIHQNFAHLVEGLSIALKRVGGNNFRIDPDHFVLDCDDVRVAALCAQLPEGPVKYKEWRLEMDIHINKNRVQLVDRDRPLDDFTKYFVNEVLFFRGHILRIKAQYSNIKNLKLRLRIGQIVIQMDFAENFTAREWAKLIQGVHWAKNTTTIHTIVVYYVIEGLEGVQHKSFVYVSPVDQHNGMFVFAILKLLFYRDLPRFFRGQDWDIDLVHYVTDGPSSQYKNRFMFWIVGNHKELFGCKAVWHYLETGHGKGPCDGVGGSLKRNAHLAASMGLTVRNAPTMFLWGIQRPKSDIGYGYVDVYDYWAAYYDRSQIFHKINTILGTRKVHSVMGGESNKSCWTRETSCSCDVCSQGTPGDNCGWKRANFLKARSLDIFEICDLCQAPLCVCLGKIAAMRKKYMDQSLVLRVPGTNIL